MGSQWATFNPNHSLVPVLRFEFVVDSCCVARRSKVKGDRHSRDEDKDRANVQAVFIIYMIIYHATAEDCTAEKIAVLVCVRACVSVCVCVLECV